MDIDNAKRVQNEMDIIIYNEMKSKSAERITDRINNNNNKRPKHDKSYRVGNYLIKNTLGCGTFGKVKLGIYLPTQEKVAVKILEKSKMTEKDDQIRLEREFEMLSQFNHPNLIMVTEIFESDNNYYTVMDYCEGGELFNYIVKNKYLSETESSFFYYQIISGLEYIHSLGIVHRDLKPENLLLTKDHILKIIDFGLSNYFKEGQNELLYTPCGSPCYASPEMVTGNNYDGIMIDIWSTGIILFAMLCGYLPFEDKNNEKLFKKIAECKIEYPDYLSDNAVDLLKKIIVPNPRKRITINEIKKHPFYLQGKELFDKEFTIQYLTDDNNSNDNTTKENEDENKKEKENNKNDKNNNIIIDDKNTGNENIIEDNKNNQRDINLENKENYNTNNVANNFIKINNNTNKKSINNKSINNNSNTNNTKKSNIYNNSESNNNNNNISININNEKINKIINNNDFNNIFLNDNISQNNIPNNNNSKKDIIINDIINDNDNSSKKNTNNQNSDNKSSNNNDIYKSSNNSDNKTIEISEKKSKYDNIYEQNCQDFYQPKVETNNKTNIDNPINNNNNKKLSVYSCNKINLEGMNNGRSIETKHGTSKKNKSNIINSNNICNYNVNNNSNDLKSIDYNKNINKKKNKLIDNNFYITEDANNSINIQKIRNTNNIMQNFRSNNNLNNTKENIKVANNENFCSNTYNTKKNKTLKGNKAINNVLGKILKINIVDKPKEKREKREKENLANKDIRKKSEISKKNEEELNQNLFNIRNTFCEGESKIFQKQKIKVKNKERKSETNNSKNKKKKNHKTKFFILNPYNYHKLTMSTDIKNNHTQIDIRAKKIISKNADINIFDIDGGNKSGRQDLCPTSMKKVFPGKKNYTDDLKINANSLNKNILFNNKLNNDYQDYILKTESNEILHTDLGVNNLEQTSKIKFKMNKNLFKMEPRLSSKDTNKLLKSTLYKKQNTGIFSSNNLKHLKINGGMIFKNFGQILLNEERLTSNRKRNFRRKFNNLSNNNNNFHNSDNKTKKYNKIFIQKKIYESYNLSNLANSYSSKINHDLFFKSNFANYNNSLNYKERKANSKTKSLKNEKIMNFSNKFPMCCLDDYNSSIDYDIKNNNNYIYNTNTLQSIKNTKMNLNNIINNNPTHGNYIRQIKKNNNYIHIKKKLKTGNDKRNKSKSMTKYKKKQKSLCSDEPSNLKLSNNLNTMRNPFHQINKTAYLNLNRKLINKHKINLKKNSLFEDSSSSTNPLVNIRNTFISFHMHPKYYLDPKKQLSTPKISLVSPANLKYSNKVHSNLKLNPKTKNSLHNNNHIRQNTSPGIESPLKKYEMNNDFMKIQQNMNNNNNIDDQKLFYYANTEYDENISSKNINLETMKNMKNRILNKKNKIINREISSNNKINSLNCNTNFNINNTKLMSNTLSPTNIKKGNNKMNININNIDNKKIADFNKNNTNSSTFKNNTIKISFNENPNKSNNYLTHYVMSGEKVLNNKKKEINIIDTSHDFTFLKKAKANLINNVEKEKYNCITTTNKYSSIKYGLNKINRKKNSYNVTNQ